MRARYIIGDVFDVLATLEPDSVDLVFSSPPFLALRSYLPADHPDKGKEIGSEATPADFLDTLLDVVEACDGALAPHGTLVFELGDTFSGSGGAGGDYAPADLSNGTWAMRSGQPKFEGSAAKARSGRYPDRDATPRPARVGRQGLAGGGKADRAADVAAGLAHDRKRPGPADRDDIVGWPLAKSLCLIPTLFAASLAYGYNMLRPERTTPRWRVRNLVVWARPNPPVGALGDKFRPATSYLTVATKSGTRYFDLDAVRGPSSPNTHARTARGVEARPTTGKAADDDRRGGNFSTLDTIHETNGAPPLDYFIDEDAWTDVFVDDVWEIPTAPYKGSHYATFPPALVVKPVKAMCPEKVCRVCGEPSRRVVLAPTELRDRHPEFAGALREARTRSGMSQAAVDELFGFNGMCSHWERKISGPQSQPAYPTPEHWAILRERLSIETSEFDSLIDGFRRWSDRELDPEYRAAVDRTRAEGFYSSTGNDGMARSGVNGRSTTSQHRTLGWSDCGHDDYRPGVVLDPFAGSGTTLSVATGHGRDAIGIDLDERNADLALERVGPMVLEVEFLSAPDLAHG